MMTRFVNYPIATVLLLTAVANAQQRQSFTATTTAILVDVVVRDRKGHPVTDLSAGDFTIAEDGVKQKIDTFTRVSHGNGIGVGVAWRSPDRTVAVTPSAPSSIESTAPRADDSTMALVFDHLSAESLRLAQKATLDYVPLTGESAARVGVFATDPGIRVVQQYTNDRALVRQAVERVMPSGVSVEEQKADRTDELLGRRRQIEAQNQDAMMRTGGSGTALAAAGSERGEREIELRLIQTELNMLRSFDNLDRAHKGYDTSMALVAIVQSLSSFPGRKTIVFFSEGLPVSPSLSARLDYVIDAANRANVTTYAVDAKGLRAKSTLTAARKEMDALVDERLTQLGSGNDRTNQPLTMAFERVEDTLRIDSRAGLARLAEETGGFLVEQSNNLSAAFQRIDEDNRFHYLLTYSPSNTVFDGKFRTIQVKVRRDGAQVFARKGYRAIGTPRAAAAGYEAPALALLDRTPLPNAFPIHAAGFSFPDPARPGLTPVVVHVATDVLRFYIDPHRSTYSGQADVVVRIRDGKGRDVQKLSQQYLLAGEAKDLDAARKGDILFYRELDLGPGVYTMESIVLDATSGEGSARVSTLTVPAAGPSALGLSSLILVNRVEDVSHATNTAAPLYVGGTLLYPNVGEPIRKSVTGELPFYFTLYGNADGVHVVAQLLRSGQPIAEAPVALIHANGSRIQHVGRFPIAALPSGTYELRISVTDGHQELTRAAFFTLRD